MPIRTSSLLLRAANRIGINDLQLVLMPFDFFRFEPGCDLLLFLGILLSIHARIAHFEIAVRFAQGNV
jgi:hypothetical protein